MPGSRLLIISAMPHHRRDGRVVGWGPTVRELDRLATRFASVRHIACLSDAPAPESALPYAATNLELVPVPPSGAEGFLGKLDVLRTSPIYVRTILRELPHADMVHVRAPAHIALIAALILAARKHPAPRWFKYAGNWRPDRRESPSYAIQRWLLERGIPRGVVTVNGEWSPQPPWVRTFWNPSLDESDVADGRTVATGKRLTSPIRLLFVGRLETPKGAARAIEVAGQLHRQGVAATLELIGDGAERAQFEHRARELGLADQVTFRGWQAPAEVYAAYARAHILLLPTAASEGWPKVLSEAMAYGVVPLAGAVSSIPQYLAKLGTGRALAPDDIDGFAAAIAGYVAEPSRWAAESAHAVEATGWFTFGHYLASIDTLLADLGIQKAAR